MFGRNRRARWRGDDHDDSGENLTPRMLVATAVIFAGVVMVIAAPARMTVPAEHLSEPEEAGL